MSRKLTLAFILGFILLSVLVSVFKVQKVKASGTICIKADGSIDPPYAPISSIDNVTYTFTGNINDSIVVERDNIVVDGAGYTVQGTGSGNGIDLTERSNVTIKNMEIKAFEYGIWLMNSSKNTISENNITNNIFSIHVCDYSHHNSISENTMTNNSHGVVLVCSSNNIVSGNMIYGNQYNFLVWGFELSHFMHSIDVSNLVNGKPAYYLVNHKGLVINPTTHPQVGYLALINCDNVTVEGLTLTNNWDGLLLAYSSNSRIKNNNIVNNYRGVVLYSSSYITVSENNITNNRCGVGLLESSNNNISGNTIANNDDEGFKIFYSSNNILSGNSITNNHDGIWLFDFLDNSISGNNITNNVRGIYLRHYSNDNKFYHNNFIDNMNQIYIKTEGYHANIWDNSYPSGGNYWSDYNGTDLCSGPFQNETGIDGIGDTSYEIDVNNEDNYPLMGMSSDFNATSEHNVQTICNSSISDIQFNGTAITFNVSGEDGTLGFCRIYIPTALINDTYKVFVNGIEVPHTLLPFSNSTHTYLYFTYEHSTKDVVIIPEFPSFLIMPLFMLATLLVIIMYRKNSKVCQS